MFSFAACCSDSSSDSSSDTVSEEEVDTEDEVTEDDLDDEDESTSHEIADADWPESHREMLRHPEDFHDKTINLEGRIIFDSKYSKDKRAVYIENEDDNNQRAIVLYEGELNEKPLEGDHFSATGPWV